MGLLISVVTLVVIFVTLVTPFLIIRSRVVKRISEARFRVSQSENSLADYRTYQKYMRNKTKTTFLKSLSLPPSHKFDRLAGSTLVRELQSISDKCERLKEFVLSYNAGYIAETVKRNVEFFTPLNLNDRQVEAIIKDDCHNLVIAPAGSGKTRVLTARIAFLTRVGADPKRILALAYGKKAAEEMRQRLQRDFHIPGVDIRTFHSYARELSNNYSPGFRSGVADQDEQREFIKSTIKNLVEKDGYYATLALNYAVACNTFEPDPNDFPDPREYYEFMKTQRYTTLNGKPVKSIAERDIGNFLFLNSVEFKYGSEATVAWAPRDPRYRDYQPDFVLPCYDDLCIEHWALGRDESVPAWFSPTGSVSEASKKYLASMRWKKDLFAFANRDLIETFNYQWYEGTLYDELKAKLLERKVVLKERSQDEVLAKLKEIMPRREYLLDGIVSFINNAKNNALTIEEIHNIIRERKWTPRQRLLATLAIPVWKMYEGWLVASNKLDFNDMVILAVEALRQRKNGIEEKPHYILIDEYQDITNSQVELIKLLKGTDESTSLFCVGDDWQSIFSFAGADVDNILFFERNFPSPETTLLKINYRCPKNIVALSNFAISFNRSIRRKEVVASSDKVIPLEYIQMPIDSRMQYDEWEIERARQILIAIARQREPGETVLVMSRNNRRKHALETKCADLANYPISFLSIHGAKGKEADYVLLLGCIRGKTGFPSEFVNGNEIDIARCGTSTHDSNDKLEEERRLLYVAITRCKKKLYIFSSDKSKSRFISEIEPMLLDGMTIKKDDDQI